MLGRPTNLIRSATRSGTFGAYPRVVRPPSGFPWSPSFGAIEQSPGVFTCSLNTAALKATTAINRYVNLARPDNSGDGLSPAAADKAIWAALNALTGATTLYILGSTDPNNPTVYDANNAWLSAVVADLNVIVVSDFTTLAPGWAVSSVESNPTVVNGHSSLPINLYVERLSFRYGTARTFYLQNVANATFGDCDFGFGASEGVTLASTAASATHTLTFVRCRAFSNANGDGFPYTASGAGATTRVLEWDCQGFSNAGGSSQGSSMHFTAGNTEASVIRIGGRYYSNGAQEVADVDSRTWMLGCRLDGAGGGLGFGVSGSGTAHLHGCVITGCATDLVTDAPSGTINVTRTIYATTSGTGTVQGYSP